jgi:hypothetical protein
MQRGAQRGAGKDDETVARTIKHHRVTLARHNEIAGNRAQRPDLLNCRAGAVTSTSQKSFSMRDMPRARVTPPINTTWRASTATAAGHWRATGERVGSSTSAIGNRRHKRSDSLPTPTRRDV